MSSNLKLGSIGNCFSPEDQKFLDMISKQFDPNKPNNGLTPIVAGVLENLRSKTRKMFSEQMRRDEEPQLVVEPERQGNILGNNQAGQPGIKEDTNPDVFDVGSFLNGVSFGGNDLQAEKLSPELLAQSNKATEVARKEDHTVKLMRQLANGNDTFKVDEWDKSFISEVCDDPNAGAISALITAVQYGNLTLEDYQNNKQYKEVLSKIFDEYGRYALPYKFRLIFGKKCQKNDKFQKHQENIVAAAADVFRCVFTSSINILSIAELDEEDQTFSYFTDDQMLEGMMRYVVHKFEEKSTQDPIPWADIINETIEAYMNSAA
jgi:uncharacterized phage-associated protein